MVSVNELRNGATFEENGTLYQVLSYEHIKMGRGSANIKIKVKNLRNGSTTEKSFINGARVNGVWLLKKELQYLYKDGEEAFFMDPRTYEQSSIPLKVLGTDQAYLKEGENFFISFLGVEPLSVQLPPKLDFVVAEAAPSVKGNSAANVYKDAVLENGLHVRVPLFIKTGDKIRIDTRTGTYSEKALRQSSG